MKLLMAGNRYLPYRHEGEKNFWLELVELLGENNSVLVISVNRDHSGVSTQNPRVHIRNVSPMLFPAMSSKFTDSRLRFSSSYVSRSASFLRIYCTMKRLLTDEGIQVSHFMDNYGPAMLRLRKMGIPLSIFAPSYHSNHPYYDFLLKSSLKAFDKIITTTHAFKRRLVAFDIPGERIEVIRWGVDTRKMRPDHAMRQEVRRRLGIESNQVLLWSGFMQQLGSKEFEYSFGLAKEVIKYARDCTFLFAFKYVHFKPEHLRYQNERIRILSTRSNADFLRLVNASDALLSPVLARCSIVAPPLTWVEAMAHGVPIITTNAEGVGELVVDGETGCTFGSAKEGVQRIIELLEKDVLRQRLSLRSRELVSEEYDIRTIAERYGNVWKGMCE
jgi:glycosyltransferase involved in cell wall biosynthesis